LPGARFLARRDTREHGRAPLFAFLGFRALRFMACNILSELIWKGRCNNMVCSTGSIRNSIQKLLRFGSAICIRLFVATADTLETGTVREKRKSSMGRSTFILRIESIACNCLLGPCTISLQFALLALPSAFLEVEWSANVRTSLKIFRVRSKNSLGPPASCRVAQCNKTVDQYWMQTIFCIKTQWPPLSVTMLSKSGKRLSFLWSVRLA
jgi:hypothetical protein